MRNRQLRASVKAALWTHYGYVESDSEPGKSHEIKQHEDGRLGCACLSYRFSKGANKTCKHVLALKIGLRVGPIAARPVDSEYAIRVIQDGEAYTVRRAISFGRIGA